MAYSMKRQTALRNKREKRDKAEEKARESAFQLLKGEEKLLSVAHACKISKSTCYRLDDSIRFGDKSQLAQLLDHANNRPGRKPVLS